MLYPQIALCTKAPDTRMGASIRDELTANGYKRVPWASVEWIDSGIDWIDGGKVWANKHTFYFGDIWIQNELEFWVVCVDANDRLLWVAPGSNKLVIPVGAAIWIGFNARTMMLTQDEYDRITNASKVKPKLRIVR